MDGDVDPIRDLETISGELRMKDQAMLKVKLEKRAALAIRTNDKKMKEEVVLLKEVSFLSSRPRKLTTKKWFCNQFEKSRKFPTNGTTSNWR